VSDDTEIKKASDRATRQTRRGGPITGNQVVPCSWQNWAQGGPFLMAGDTGRSSQPANTLRRTPLRTSSCGTQNTRQLAMLQFLSTCINTHI
jgi:hypothetical protein